MNRLPRARRLLAAALTTLSAAAGLQVALAAPAHAGQVGLTVTIGGRGWVEVVEGAGRDQPLVCRNETARTNLDRVSCERVRGEAVFAATVWLRAHPGVGDDRGEWSFSGWARTLDCDSIRTRNGWEECGISSGAVSSDEKTALVVFDDRTPPPAPVVRVTTDTRLERAVHLDVRNDAPETTNACAVDGVPFGRCADQLYTLDEGAHTLTGYSLDPSKNRSAPVDVPFYVVDTAVVSGPPALTSSRTAEFQVSSGAGTRFVCSLETFAEPVGCAEGATTGTLRFSNLTDGKHTLTVAAEKGGWKDGVPATYEWTVDSLAPTTYVGLDNVKDNTDVRIGVSASEPSTSECRITKEGSAVGEWKPCLQNINSFPGLTSGAYLFDARSTDAAGNTGNIARYRHVVDADGPDVHVVPEISGSTATFRIDAPAATRVLCKETHLGVGDQWWHACTSPVVMSDLAVGEHSLEVRAVDAYSNWTLPSVVHTFQVRPPVVATPDRTAPETTLLGGPAEGTILASTSATLSAGATEAATYSCFLDTIPVACPGGQLSLSGLGAGRHVLAVAAVDAAGNRDATPATRTWNVAAGSRALTTGRGKAKGFKQVSTAAAFGGAEAVAKRKGATLVGTVAAARTIAVVAAPGKGQGKVAVSVGGRRIATLNLAKGPGTTTLLTLPALPASYSGAVSITSLSAKPVRIQGLGWS